MDKSKGKIERKETREESEKGRKRKKEKRRKERQRQDKLGGWASEEDGRYEW